MAFCLDKNFQFTPGLKASNGNFIVHALCDAWRKMKDLEGPEKFDEQDMLTTLEQSEETVPKQFAELLNESREKLSQQSHEKSTQYSDANLSQQCHKSLPEKFSENLPQIFDENLPQQSMEILSKLRQGHENKTTQTRSRKNSFIESIVLDLQIRVLQFQLQFFEKMVKRDMDKKFKSIESGCDEIISNDPSNTPSSYSDNFDDLDKFPVRLNVSQESNTELPVVRESDSTASEKETRQRTRTKRSSSKKEKKQPDSPQKQSVERNEKRKTQHKFLSHDERQPHSPQSLPIVQNEENRPRYQSIAHVERQLNSSRSSPTVENREKKTRYQCVSHESKKPTSVKVPNKCDMPLDYLKTRLTVSKNGHHHMKFTDVPFILGTSTTPSHSLTANVQQIIGELKTHNRFCSSSAVTSKEHNKGSEKHGYSKVLRELGKDFNKLSSEREMLEQQLLENEDSQGNKKLHEKYKDIKSLLDMKAKEIIDWHKCMKSETTLKSKYTVDSRPRSEPSLPTQRFLRAKIIRKTQL